MTDRSADPIGSSEPGSSVVAEPRPERGRRDLFAAIDLGTNNCRLLIAREDGYGRFRVVDAFSRSVRLGEGLSATGALSDAAIERTLAALKVCAGKMRRAGVTYSRAIATEACRVAANSAHFIRRIAEETGLKVEIISAGEEAKLCAQGCAPLVDPKLENAIVFDIGGGSTELIWMRRVPARADVRPRLASWASVPIGVVSLAERFGGAPVWEGNYPAMVTAAEAAFASALDSVRFAAPQPGAAMHLLGTSGTVTTLAAIHLGLPRYDRNRVDGLWMRTADIEAVVRELVVQDIATRAANPCVGQDRADLVLPGCAILDAILSRFPCPRMRIADRGLREGILLTLIAKAEKERWRRHRQSRKFGAGP